VLWAGVLWSHGWLFSVRNALTDGPSVLLTALAVLALDRGRPWFAAGIIGLSGLARETNVLAATMLASMVKGDWRTWWRPGAAALLCVAPLLLWLDYLRSIYRDAAFAGGDHFVIPLSGFLTKVTATIGHLLSDGMSGGTVASATMLVGFVAQAVALGWCTWVWWRSGTGARSWLLVAWPFLLLGLVMHSVVCECGIGCHPAGVVVAHSGSEPRRGQRRAGLWPGVDLIGSLEMRRRLLTALCGLLGVGTLAVATLAAAPVQSGQWLQWRGPFHTGMAVGDAPLRWSDTDGVTWKVPIPGRGHSTPVVVGDRLLWPRTTAIARSSSTV
jgi:hypothetical protein